MAAQERELALNALHDLIHGTPDDVQEMTDEAVEEELANLGIETDSPYQALMKEIERAEKKARVRNSGRARERAKRVIAELRKRVRNGVSSQSRDEVLQKMREALGNSPQARMFCHKFEQADGEDIAGIVIDLGMMDELEKVLEEDGKED